MLPVKFAHSKTPQARASRGFSICTTGGSRIDPTNISTNTKPEVSAENFVLNEAQCRKAKCHFGSKALQKSGTVAVRQPTFSGDLQ